MQPNCNEEVLNKVEMAILGILSTPTHEPLEDNSARLSRKKDEITINLNRLPLKRQPKYVTFAFGQETESDSRLFTADMEMLLTVPDHSFGVVVISDELIKESSLSLLKKVPKGFASYGSCDSVYQYDYIATDIKSLKCRLMQSVIAVKGRKVITLFPVNTPKEFIALHSIRVNKENSMNFAMMSSILEDYNLNQFWHIDLTDSVTIATYAKESAVKSFLDIRKDPLTPTGQRKRVLHWVSGHRRNVGDQTITVPRHLRGLETFELGGFKVEITQPQKQTSYA